MLTPSNITAVGFAPTLKVPSAAPSLARSLVTLLLPEFDTQILAPSKATAVGMGPHGEGSKGSSIARSQLCHAAALIIRHPAIGSIQGYPGGRVDAECTEHHSIAGSQLG